MLHLLRRFIDYVEHRKQEVELRRKREAIPPEADRAPKPPPPTVCRICGHTGEGRFCMTCLAETMTPVK